MNQTVLQGINLLRPDSLEVGAYVVVSLDPTESLHSLRDPVIDLAASQLQSRKYVGLVNRIWTRDDSDHSMKVEVFFVGQGMPTETPDTVVNPSMSTPILPATEHPFDREPLVPSRPLPWSNCYQHSFMNMTLIVSSIDQCNASGIVLSKEDVHRHYQNTLVDREREKLLVRLWEIAEEDQATDTGLASRVYPDSIEDSVLGSDSEPYLTAEEEEHLDISDGSPVRTPATLGHVLRVPSCSDVTRLDFDLTSFAESPPFHIMDFVSPHSVELTCKLSLDLSLVPELPNPRDFFKEIDQIYSLEREADERWRESRRPDKESLIATWLHGTEYQDIDLPPFSPLRSEHIPTSPTAIIDLSRLEVNSSLPRPFTFDEASLSGSTQHEASGTGSCKVPPPSRSGIVLSVKHRLRSLPKIFHHPRRSPLLRFSASKS